MGGSVLCHQCTANFTGVKRANFGIDRADFGALGITEYGQIDRAGQMVGCILGRCPDVDDGIDGEVLKVSQSCLLYTSDAADE